MGLNTIRSTVFSGGTNIMALGHPYIAPAYTSVMGIPFAIDVRTRKVVYFDPWLLKDAGVLHSAFGIFLGPKGYGKSATMKILAIRLMMLAAGYSMMRIAINDFKPEGKESEYGAFTRVCRSKVFQISELSFNPFERRLFMREDKSTYELGVLDVAQVILEFIKDDKLVGYENDALRVAVYCMLQYDEIMWSVPTLFKLLRSITRDSIIAYYNTLDSTLQSQLEARLESVDDASLKDNVQRNISDLVGSADNTDLAAIQHAGEFLASLLHRLLVGSYGRMIGTEHSLYDLLTQRVVTKDWRGVQPEAEALMRIIDTRVKIGAIETNRMDLLPHIELDDEKHKAMDNLTYAETHSFFSEISRGTPVCNLSATHRLASIRKGGVGSKQYNLGNTIIHNLGFTFVSRQDNDPAVLSELQQLHGLSDSDTRLLPRLPRYNFGMKLGEEEPIRFLRVFATPLELNSFLATDSATDAMIDRPLVYDQSDIERFAAENGVMLLGEELL